MWLLKTAISLTVVYLGLKLVAWLRTRKRLVEMIEKLPGPPNISFIPILNHSVVVLYLDSLKLRLGTFCVTYHCMSYLTSLFPDTGICRFWLGLKPVVILYSPENAESILVSQNVIDKSSEYRFLEPLLGEGLITSKKLKWRFRRKILTPAFHFRILNDFLPVINEEASKFIRKLNQIKYTNDVEGFDITPLVTYCTLDTICETAMGIKLNSQDEGNSEYVKCLKDSAEIALARIARPWQWVDTLFYFSDQGKKFVKANKMMNDFTTKVILERKAAWQRELNFGDESQSKPSQSGQVFDDVRTSSFFKSGRNRLAFLDLILQQHLVENKMSIDDILEEVNTFMFAGHDTTAMCISWTIYMLGLHEDIQQRVRDELDNLLGMSSEPDGLWTDDITVEHLKSMKYLDCVIKETLRMWPSVPFVAREMTEDTLVDNKYLIPQGATCMVFTHMLHNNPKYYPRPEIFDPDRFTPEQMASRHPFAYIPFSAGPRNCIGQKFAQMEVKIIVAKVIKNYVIKTVDHRDKLAVVGELVLRSRNGLNVRITPRFT